MNAVLTPDIESRVTLAQAVADAERDLAALQVRIQNATALRLSPSDRRAVVAPLQAELAVVEARRNEAVAAVNRAAQATKDEQARALKAARAQVYAEAKPVVAKLVPLVERVNVLNEQLEGIRARVGYPSDIPVSFRPHLLTVEKWLQFAKSFVRHG